MAAVETSADGRTYRFDRVCPMEAAATVDRDELYVAPGLVYQAIPQAVAQALGLPAPDPNR